MPTLSIVIPTRNGGPLFRKVLARLRTQIWPDVVDILIIDSGSQDDTLSYAREFAARIYAIPSASYNHGATRDLAISETRGDIIVLLTQDALPVDEGLLTHLAAPYVDPAVGGVYARQIPRPEHDCLIQRNLAAYAAGSTTPVTRQITDLAAFARLTPMERYIHCTFDNVCASVRRTAWQRLPFGQRDFGEDLDWAKRALEAGWQIVYQPAAAVIHSHARSARYEYRRTYLCHWQLCELFGVSTIPTLGCVPRSLAHSIVQDSLYALGHAPTLRQRLGLLLRIPALSAATVLGQYHGARDQRRGRRKRMSGV